MSKTSRCAVPMGKGYRSCALQADARAPACWSGLLPVATGRNLIRFCVLHRDVQVGISDTHLGHRCQPAKFIPYSNGSDLIVERHLGLVRSCCSAREQRAGPVQSSALAVVEL